MRNVGREDEVGVHGTNGLQDWTGSRGFAGHAALSNDQDIDVGEQVMVAEFV